MGISAILLNETKKLAYDLKIDKRVNFNGFLKKLKNRGI